jgi:hypothetical protein
MMSPPGELQVSVIYDGSRPRGVRGRLSPGTGRDPRARWFLVGLMNVVAAGGLYYGAWWRIDAEVIYPRLILRTPLPGVELEQFANLFGPPTEPGARGPAVRASSDQASRDARQEAQEAGVLLWATAYGWLAVTTIACWILATSAGSLLGRGLGRGVHRASGWLAGVAVAGLLVAAGVIWSRQEMGFPPDTLRVGVGGLILTGLLFGVSIGRGVRGLLRAASLVLVLSSVATVAALVIGARVDAVDAEQVTPLFLAGVFAAQSAWGWVLLPISWRIAG